MVRAPFHRAASQARGYEAPMNPERCGAAFTGGRAMGNASASIRRTPQKGAWLNFAFRGFSELCLGLAQRVVAVIWANVSAPGVRCGEA